MSPFLPSLEALGKKAIAVPRVAVTAIAEVERDPLMAKRIVGCSETR